VQRDAARAGEEGGEEMISIIIPTLNLTVSEGAQLIGVLITMWAIMPALGYFMYGRSKLVIATIIIICFAITIIVLSVPGTGIRVLDFSTVMAGSINI
jgi:hypothetical protein